LIPLPAAAPPPGCTLTGRRSPRNMTGHDHRPGPEFFRGVAYVTGRGEYRTPTQDSSSLLTRRGFDALTGFQGFRASDFPDTAAGGATRGAPRTNGAKEAATPPSPCPPWRPAHHPQRRDSRLGGQRLSSDRLKGVAVIGCWITTPATGPTREDTPWWPGGQTGRNLRRGGSPPAGPPGPCTALPTPTLEYVQAAREGPARQARWCSGVLAARLHPSIVGHRSAPIRRRAETPGVLTPRARPRTPSRLAPTSSPGRRCSGSTHYATPPP